jgi:hypothetical protein
MQREITAELDREILEQMKTILDENLHIFTSVDGVSFEAKYSYTETKTRPGRIYPRPQGE